MAVDAIIWHWVNMVAGEEALHEVFGWAFQWLAAFFYAYDGILAYPQPACLQVVLEAPTGIFDWVGLRMNVNKMVGMVF